jgi:uncharacterized protein with ATP-grasp and redox domains
MLKSDPDSLQIWQACHDCILGIVRDSFSMMEKADPSLMPQVMSIAGNILTNAFEKGWSSPVAANKILREVRQLSGVTDPYESFKKKEIDLARKIFSQAKLLSGPDLRSRIVLSVLGNSLDFFTNPEEALLSLPNILQRGITFYHDDIDRFEQFIVKRPKNVLFFTDNSGEVFFDIPFFQFIRDQTEHTVLVVKGAPSLNDLTRVEIKKEKLEQYFINIEDTGIEGVGIDWDLTSQTFKDLVRSADLIVSKGMANFETVYPKKLSAHVFFLLKSKCRPIQDYIGAPPEAYCAIWKEGIR